MAKEVTVHAWCDVHMSHDERVDGVEHTITVDQLSRTVDLCAKCATRLLDELVALLRERGAPVEPSVASRVGNQGQRLALRQAAGVGRRYGREPRSGEREAMCLWCPLTYSSSASSGYARHIKVVHGYATLREAFGQTCAVCGSQQRMLIAHVKLAHPEFGSQPHQSTVALWARDHGDPHGVYAATVNRTPSLTPDEAWTKTRESESREEGRQ